MGLGQQDSNNDNREGGLDYRNLQDFGAGNPEEQKICDLGVGCEWFGGRGGEKFSGEMGHTDYLSYSYLVWESPVWVVRKVSSGPQTFSSVVSNSLWLHRLQHARLPCPSLTPRAYSTLYPSSGWCHPTISSSVVPFSSCLQCFPTSGSFQMNQFFTSGGQSIGSFSLSVSPSSEHSGLISFRMDWFDLLAVQRTLKNFLQHHSSNFSEH